MTPPETPQALVEIEPRLAEEVVLLAMPGHEQEAGFRRRRNRLYEIGDPEEREAAFQALHLKWFRSLEMDGALYQALAERPLILQTTHRCFVGQARSKRDEGAELYVDRFGAPHSPTTRRSVRILVLPRTFQDPIHLLGLLRHELLHIHDMLDPDFGYDPSLPAVPGGILQEQLTRDRYRVLWDLTIDGRLHSAGFAPPSVRGERLREFRETFPMMGSRSEGIFERLFRDPSPTHRLLLELAIRPESPAIGGSPNRCSPAGFPADPARD